MVGRARRTMVVSTAPMSTPRTTTINTKDLDLMVLEREVG